jgi:inner membrane protein
MDTLTHALSGALIARLITTRQPILPAPPSAPAVGRFSAPWDGQAGSPLPWQGVVAGLVAGAFPDIDAVAQLFGDVAYLTHHRGITHSVLLLPLWAFGLAWLLARCFAVTRAQAAGWKSLYAFTVAGLAIHIAGDWITQFGTMLLAPLSDRRFGLGSMFIIDLVFTGALLAGLVLAALWPRQRWPAALGLAAAVGWVGVATMGQYEAIGVGERQARALGIAEPDINVMPRPASPFNWTVSVSDGSRYHMSHVNTRRSEPLQAGADDNFVRRFSAPYEPVATARWQTVPRFGDEGTPPWVRQAWEHEAFGFFRWFAQTPALLKVQVSASGDERCAWFRDLRFEFPGRDVAPFRYGVCFNGDASSAVVYKLEGGQRLPV